MSGRKTSNEVFSSEGFDLDALANAEADGKDVVLEIGGKSTVISSDNNNNKTNDSKPDDDAIAKSEEYKAQGNEHFKKGNYLDAYDYYTDAIEACPGITGKEILKLKKEYDEMERQKAYERHRKETEFRRKNNHNDEKETPKDAADQEEEKPEKFEVPTHEFASKLAVYHCNRAACLLHMLREEDAIEDCDIALLFNPSYVKALVRRMTAHERLDQTEEALHDAKEAFALDPRNNRQNVNRLQKKENERMEKLKEETMGKLKDLGNSILGNFGLSLDNFQTQKDPNTGSYNISFNNK